MNLDRPYDENVKVFEEHVHGNYSLFFVRFQRGKSYRYGAELYERQDGGWRLVKNAVFPLKKTAATVFEVWQQDFKDSPNTISDYERRRRVQQEKASAERKTANGSVLRSYRIK